jgi:peptide/nickel transport system ATP-binding protein
MCSRSDGACRTSGIVFSVRYEIETTWDEFDMNLLDIADLNVSLPTSAGVVHASNGVTLSVRQGETHCLIGESGCGKTIVALGIMRLLPENAKVSGKIVFNGKNLFSLSEKEMRKIRGREIAIIFEQPQSCLNPVFSVGYQIAEAVRIHEKCSVKASEEKAIELMTMVKIPDAERKYRQYPHEYSGGMAQRAMIAMAMALQPSLLIADEPTTSLDTVIRAQIMAILKDLVTRFGTSLILITHDLEAAFRICEYAAVMYAGYIVEERPVRDILKTPKHPYTKALISAVSGETSSSIRGYLPELTRLPTGCPFHPRCEISRKICTEVIPQIKKGVRCHLQERM